METRIRHEQTIVVMLLLGLAAALGFFDVAFAAAAGKSPVRRLVVSPPPLPETVVPVVTEPTPVRPPVTLLFAGDVMLSRHIDTLVQRAKSPSFPWDLVREQTSAADLFFVNLEAPFSEQGPYDDDNMIFAVRPEYVAGLVAAGVDVVSFANNH